MSYRIQAIELYVRETLPGRMAFSLGKKGGAGDVQQGLLNPLGHVRLVLKDSSGRETFGCSGDRLSVRWLDKRADRSFDQKRRELVELIETARTIALAHREFETPFEFWQTTSPEILKAGRAAGQEDLTSALASSLMERAVIDAVCRISDVSVFQAAEQDRLGIRPGDVYPELRDFEFSRALPEQPRTRFLIRHTIGMADPLVDSDLSDEQRVNDGLPETLEEYVRTDGLRSFKIKISGDTEHDLARLSRIWDVIVQAEQPVITLDANEAFADLKQFAAFVTRYERELVGMFQHVAYIEQPLPRNLTLDPRTASEIRKLAERKPLLIDEADGKLEAFHEAHAIGYAGTSHKNCKGVFKSLLNLALVHHFLDRGEPAFLSGEDLQNLPVVPLHQDFATLGMLDLEDCERNGHHYNRGLSMLSEREKTEIARRHRDLYVRRDDEWFLDIREGAVDCASLQCPGFGVAFEPDWASMTPLREWLDRRHPVG
jgi:hypothetical protein